MQRITLWTLGFGSLLVASLLLGGSPRHAISEEDPHGEDWTERAQKAWSHTCQKCHTVPDERFETGRAFLKQITGTS